MALGARQRTALAPEEGPGYPLPVTARARAILDQALRLGVAEREDLIEALRRSIDRTADLAPGEQDEIARQWDEEIARRADRALRGESTGRPADEVLADARARLRAMHTDR